MKRLFLISVFILSISTLWAQEGSPTNIKNGFDGISMGMDKKAVQDKLYQSAFFYYRGEPEVTMSEKPSETLLNCPGRGIVEKATFHFYEGKLFVITLILNRKEIDYYTLFTQFTKKYGEPVDMSPKRAIWESETTRLGLENPLAIRFVDIEIFNSKVKVGTTEKNLDQKRREDFLELF